MNTPSASRRRLLKGGLAAGALFLPLPYAWIWAQQADGGMKLLRLPKIALVIGNSKYKEAPLKNPANDARAIADALKSSGFEVTLKMDAGKADMAAAVQAYAQALASKQAVGLFYYAGHGIQLAWKNYMLPVDADIDTIGDVQKQAMEVNALMEGLTKARNPMNVVILDACRDNPFGNLKGAEHKGLSQMDAPTHTLLAYATSPGNVASDGAGANGLYTESLLKELKVPEAKIEDVFKRVRLGVRVKSKGEQIPWESTSLEDDFYFLPPKEMKVASEPEKEKLFDQELAQWEQAKAATSPGPLEEFLRRYPSGNFAELAQLRLDQLLAKQGEKKLIVSSQAGNPFTKGSTLADIGFKVGDSYGYVQTDQESKAELQKFVDTVTRITDDEVHLGNGKVILDRLGNTIQLPDGRRFTPRQDQPLEYAVGRRWSTRYTTKNTAGGRADIEQEFRITGKEKITVPAGTFDCYVIEGTGVGVNDRGGKVTLALKRWMAPDQVRRPVASENSRRVEAPAGGGNRKGRSGPRERVLNSERLELVSFKQS